MKKLTMQERIEVKALLQARLTLNENEDIEDRFGAEYREISLAIEEGCCFVNNCSGA